MTLSTLLFKSTRRFSDCVNRVRYQGTTFVLQ
jgi:hypothetical protein